MLSISYTIMLVHTRLNDRWRVTHNAFEHITMGSTDFRVQRAGHHTNCVLGDYLEALLGFGAGTLEIINMRGEVVRRISNIPRLFWLAADINRIIERVAVTDVDEEAAVASEVEEVS
jgi:hypothetical protein